MLQQNNLEDTNEIALNRGKMFSDIQLTNDLKIDYLKKKVKKGKKQKKNKKKNDAIIDQLPA